MPVTDFYSGLAAPIPFVAGIIGIPILITGMNRRDDIIERVEKPYLSDRGTRGPVWSGALTLAF